MALVGGATLGRRRSTGAQARSAYVFIAPFLVIFAIFTLVPSIYAIVLSFQRNRGYGPSVNVGFANYHNTLTYPVFWTELGNTVFYWLVHAIPLIPIAFLLAVLVRSRVVRLKEFWKTVIFLPQVMSIIAVALVFQTLFSQQYGVVNSLFHTHIGWLTNPSDTRWIVVLLLLWQELGFWFIVFLAGLTSIDPELIEAATIDGANAMQRLRRVVVPLLRNVFLFAFVVDAIASISLYSQPNVLTSNGLLAPTSISPVLDLLVQNVQGGEFGLAAAVGWLIFLVTVLVSAIVFLLFQWRRT